MNIHPSSFISHPFSLMNELIKLSNLSRQFRRGENDVLALRGVDLMIAQGEFVALVGPSGSGKSTLLNLLGGLDRPSDGELWLNGTALHNAEEKERTAHRRERVGFIFQSFNLMQRLTAVENVAVPLMLAGVDRAEREQRAAELLKQVGLGHRLDHYPTELSGGEQQRTAVSRALIHNPTLILADEPTGNLDSKTGDEVMGLLKKLNQEQGITLIVVTHDEEVAAFADRIVKLRDGAIIEIVDNGAIVEIVGEVNESGTAKAVEATPQSQSGLKFRDIALTAVQNLGRRRIRNVLTAAGVLIGILTLVAMVSLGVGVQKEVQRNFEQVGLENIFVNPKYAEQDGFDPFAELELETPLTPELVEQLRGLDNVTAVTPQLNMPSGIDINLLHDENEISVRVTDGFGEARFGPGTSNEPLAGKMLADGETTGAVLINGLADKLLADGESYDDLIGRTIILQARLPRGETAVFESNIIGVRDSSGSRTLDLGVDEHAAIIAWWFDEPNFLSEEGYNMVIVRATALGFVDSVIADIETFGMNTQSFGAILDVANQVLSLLQALLGSVGGLALLVAALGVANTMMMAIYERTREIGVLKALGASPKEIRAMFTVEAGLIGVIGGVFGIILGALLGRLVNWIAHQFLIREGVTGVGQLSIVPLWLALGALAFAALIGVLAGLYPAARAAKLDPVTALRHE